MKEKGNKCPIITSARRSGARPLRAAGTGGQPVLCSQEPREQPSISTRSSKDSLFVSAYILQPAEVKLEAAEISAFSSRPLALWWWTWKAGYLQKYWMYSHEWISSKMCMVYNTGTPQIWQQWQAFCQFFALYFFCYSPNHRTGLLGCQGHRAIQ